MSLSQAVSSFPEQAPVNELLNFCSGNNLKYLHIVIMLPSVYFALNWNVSCLLLKDYIDETYLNGYDVRLGFNSLLGVNGTTNRRTASADIEVTPVIMFNQSHITPILRVQLDGEQVTCEEMTSMAGRFSCSLMLKESDYRLRTVAVRAEAYSCDGTVLDTAEMTIVFGKSQTNIIKAYKSKRIR